MANEEKMPPADAQAERPPIPPDRLMSVPCGTCLWNAWVSIPTPVRELHYDKEDKTGEVRGMQFQLIVCSGCGTRLLLNRDEQGHLVPSFDQPRNPLYRDVLSGRVTVGK